MNQASFRPKAYLKVGCPFSFKVLLFAAEAQLLSKFDIVRCDPERPDYEAIKAKLEQATGLKASFPTVQVGPDAYRTDSDELIAYFAQQENVRPETLQALSFYKESIFPQLLECHQAKGG